MIELYNTLTRKKEQFRPMGDRVKIYSCGPTVYSRAHIGNMRAYIFVDNLRKVLMYNGYSLQHVMNITDVGHLTSDEDYGEDKMELTAKKDNVTPQEIANKYTQLFMEDCKKLNIEIAETVAKATEHIQDMEEYVEKIYDNGFAYETSKGIYFDTSKLSTYGELSHINIEGQKSGARIDVDEEKKNPLDFALWIKAPENHIMKWDSRWGKCYPGWHIECSAMGQKYLGKRFDIHTGGVDHIPIHHENEIAQSRGAYNVNPANYWIHNEFLLIDGGKMSKSLGNVYTVTTLEEKGFSPLAYRYMTYTASYRNKLNFTWEALKSAQTSLIRLKEAYAKHANGENKDIDLSQYKKDFLQAINDDLNFPNALAVVWELAKIKEANINVAKLLYEFDKVLSLSIYLPIESIINELPEQVKQLLKDRQEARNNKDYHLSDLLREKINQLGYNVIDTKEGQEVERNI